MSDLYTTDGRRRASMAHAKHTRYRSCGRIVHGNGFAHHRTMHERAGDGHRRVTQTQFGELFPGYWELPWPERGARKISGPRPDAEYGAGVRVNADETVTTNPVGRPILHSPSSCCVLCLRSADAEQLAITLPDGCRAHHSCWLRADYEELRMHAEPHLHEAECGTPAQEATS